MFENPRRGRQARTFAKNVPKTLDLKSSSEQDLIISLVVLAASKGNYFPVDSAGT